MSDNMTSSYTKLGIAMAVVVIAAALLSVNIQSTLAQQKPTDSITMTVNLQTHENEILANQVTSKSIH
jgi:hypothetical protein